MFSVQVFMFSDHKGIWLMALWRKEIDSTIKSQKAAAAFVLAFWARQFDEVTCAVVSFLEAWLLTLCLRLWAMLSAVEAAFSQSTSLYCCVLIPRCYPHGLAVNFFVAECVDAAVVSSLF